VHRVSPRRLPWRRLLPGLTVAIYLAAVLAWVGGDRRSARDAFPAGSVWNTGDDGLSLAFAYLGARAAGTRQGAGAAVLRRAVDGAALPADAVVLRIAPDPALAPPAAGQTGDETGHGIGGRTATTPHAGPLLTTGEERWIEGGGRLVLAVGAGYGPLTAATAAHPQPPAPLRKAFPLWPGVARLLPHPRRTLAGPPLAAAQALWLDGEAPVAARLRLGDGDVVLLACPEIFFNGRLGEGDHLALLDALAAGAGSGPGTLSRRAAAAGGAGRSGMGARGAGGTGGGIDANGTDGGKGGGGLGAGTGVPNRVVYFDERAHGAGEQGGAVEILASWGFAPLLLLGAVAAGVAFWHGAVRLGPADRDDSDDRSEAVELVDSLASLYDRALGRADAIRLYHDSFVHTVAADAGLRGAALTARAAELAAGFSAADLAAAPALAGQQPAGRNHPADISRAAFDRALQLLNQAFRRLDDAKRG
jgi:hypothetical protein